MNDGGTLVFRPKVCPLDTAKALLATKEMGELLPSANLLVRAPVLFDDNGQPRLLAKGYHDCNGGILITGGKKPEEVSLDDAVPALQEIISEFDFQTPGDRSRALAAMITPAMKMGGFIKETIPVDVAEADASQSGKGYRQKLIAAIYREKIYLIAKREGGVGSLDESISSALFVRFAFHRPG